MFGLKTPPVEKPPVKATDILQQTVAARLRAPGSIAVIARNVGASPQELGKVCRHGPRAAH